MDWKAALEKKLAAVGHIVALLHSLADLAERAAGRCLLVRCLVLWLLRHAETAVRDLLSTPDTPAQPIPVAPGNSRTDALQLAINLRTLARQLDLQARLLLSTCPGNGGDGEPRPAGLVPASRDALDTLSSLATFAGHQMYPRYAPDTS